MVSDRRVSTQSSRSGNGPPSVRRRGYFGRVFVLVWTAGSMRAMGETRKLAAIVCSDVVGYSRLAGADEDRILARLRALRSDLIDPTIAVHHGRIVNARATAAL